MFPRRRRQPDSTKGDSRTGGLYHVSGNACNIDSDKKHGECRKRKRQNQLFKRPLLAAQRNKGTRLQSIRGPPNHVPKVTRLRKVGTSCQQSDTPTPKVRARDCDRMTKRSDDSPKSSVRL